MTDRNDTRPAKPSPRRSAPLPHHAGGHPRHACEGRHPAGRCRPLMGAQRTFRAAPWTIPNHAMHPWPRRMAPCLRRGDEKRRKGDRWNNRREGPLHTRHASHPRHACEGRHPAGRCCPLMGAQRTFRAAPWTIPNHAMHPWPCRMDPCLRRGDGKERRGDGEEYANGRFRIVLKTQRPRLATKATGPKSSKPHSKGHRGHARKATMRVHSRQPTVGHALCRCHLRSVPAYLSTPHGFGFGIHEKVRGQTSRLVRTARDNGKRDPEGETPQALETGMEDPPRHGVQSSMERSVRDTVQRRKIASIAFLKSLESSVLCCTDANHPRYACEGRHPCGGAQHGGGDHGRLGGTACFLQQAHRHVGRPQWVPAFAGTTGRAKTGVRAARRMREWIGRMAPCLRRGDERVWSGRSENSRRQRVRRRTGSPGLTTRHVPGWVSPAAPLSRHACGGRHPCGGAQHGGGDHGRLGGTACLLQQARRHVGRPQWVPAFAGTTGRAKTGVRTARRMREWIGRMDPCLRRGDEKGRRNDGGHGPTGVTSTGACMCGTPKAVGAG